MNTPAANAFSLNLGGEIFDLSTPCVMGILNITPDSFYDGGRYYQHAEARRAASAVTMRAGELLAEGAAILDVGGYSTRPGAAEVSVAEEIDRVCPVIEQIKQHYPQAVVSVDTFRAAVANAAVAAGAAIINDVSGGNLDPDMFATVARLRVPYVLMHMRGTPQTMTQLNHYQNLVTDILDELLQKIHALRALGVYQLIVDPGFGFAKNIAQNFALLNHLDAFGCLNLPLLAGLSRKSMIYKTLQTTPAEALNGTTALNMVALQKGANILRVHDVRAAKETITLYQALQANASLT